MWRRDERWGKSSGSGSVVRRGLRGVIITFPKAASEYLTCLHSFLSDWFHYWLSFTLVIFLFLRNIGYNIGGTIVCGIPRYQTL